MPSHKNNFGKFGRSLSKNFGVKKVNVKNAHKGVSEILKTFGVPIVKKTFGKRIVRVCCKTILQLQNIVFITKHLVESDLIQEIGMALKYELKMRTMVLYIKPMNDGSSKKIGKVFEESLCKYRHHVIDVDYPTVAAYEISKENEKITNVENTNMEKGTRHSVRKRKKTQLELKTLVCTTKQESMKNVNLIKSAPEEQNETSSCMKLMLFLILIEILIITCKLYTN